MGGGSRSSRALPAASSRDATSQALGDGIETSGSPSTRKKARHMKETSSQKRKCVSTACIACRKRKSKCDGALPSCAACASVYGTKCIYDPNSDHRRKGVYREKMDSMKTRSSTLQVLVQAILEANDDDVSTIVGKIRDSDSLDSAADYIIKHGSEFGEDAPDQTDEDYIDLLPVEGERDLARKMGELRVDNGAVRFIGGTSNLIYLENLKQEVEFGFRPNIYTAQGNPVTSWTTITADPDLIMHLIGMYFNYHYPYFTSLCKKLFWRDFMKGKGSVDAESAHCSPLLVNAILALGCHFSDVPGAFAVPSDSATKGDHFFAEAKRLMVEDEEYTRPQLTNVQALSLMSIREAACAREDRGWALSGISFQLAQDMSLNIELRGSARDQIDDEQMDARRITFWGCFNIDKFWSNHMGRLPRFDKDSYNVEKFDVFPEEDASMWSPLTETGFDQAFQQPSRIRAVALHLSALSEISGDILTHFYPGEVRKPSSKSFQLKKLSELHRRLEEWRSDIPKELEPRDGQLPSVILMHMFFHLQYIHLFRPFLRYDPTTSPLPSHVSPRRICTANAGAISKLMRLYKKSYSLRQICSAAIYITHSACIIHLLNLPDKMAKRDIIHSVRHLEEIAESWPSAARTLNVISALARKWKCELPEEAGLTLQRADEKYGYRSISGILTPTSAATTSPRLSIDDSGTTSQGGYSPLTQYTQTHISQARPCASVDGGLVMDIDPSLRDIGAFSQSQPTLVPPGCSNLDFSPEYMAGWNSPNVASSSPAYSPTSSSVKRSHSIQSGVDQADMRHESPGYNGRVEGQEWMLHDGAGWHNGFASWEMTPNIIAGSQFVFEGNKRGNRASARQGNPDFSGFEGLDASFGGTDWLSGLE